MIVFYIFLPHGVYIYFPVKLLCTTKSKWTTEIKKISPTTAVRKTLNYHLLVIKKNIHTYDRTAVVELFSHNTGGLWPVHSSLIKKNGVFWGPRGYCNFFLNNMFNLKGSCVPRTLKNSFAIF